MDSPPPDKWTQQVATIASLLDGRQVAVAESLTCGRIARAFAEAEGSTGWFRGGVTAWQHHAKYTVLGLEEGSPVVNETAASTMARGAARLFDADVVVATTGAAGPSGQDGAPPGTVYLAAFVDGAIEVRELELDASPDEVCDAATAAALALLADALRRPPGRPARDDSGTDGPGLDELPAELRSRVLAATGQPEVRVIRRHGRTGDGDEYEVQALTGDRVVSMVLSLRPDGSVAEATDTCVLDEITAIERNGEAWLLTVAGPTGSRTIPVAADVAGRLQARSPARSLFAED